MKGITACVVFTMLTSVSLGQVTIRSVKGRPFLSMRGERSFQSIDLTVENAGDSVEATIMVDGAPPLTVGVGKGNRDIEAYAPETAKTRETRLRVEVGQKTVYKGQVSLEPVRKMTVYILPHSHNDLGYTEIQTNVERKQMNNLLTGIDYSERTKSYPAGARFVWNLEGIYAADLFLNRMNEQQRRRFIEAVHDGGVALNGMYVNTLTGICGPEELLQLFHRGTEVAALCGTTVDAAMISDVPGYTWGTVTAMAQAGIKYFSAAPNNFDRIGDILEQWEDKPFYWIGPSGKEKVLVWIPYRGYALSHGMPDGLTKKFVGQYMAELDRKQFKYDISYIRWSGHGDNATPDMTICDFVKDWNTTYTWPRFVISSTSIAFKAFEDRYGAEIPKEKGDWTGYWEDGAGSSAFETAENRATSARMNQGEALWAMKNRADFPADKDRDAWRNVILYSEHTWGADVSVTRPLSQKTMEQWIIKRSYATNADSLSCQLMSGALDQGVVASGNSVDVFNTHSWSRSGLVLVPKELSLAGDLVKDAAGQVLTSQRLSTGELAFMAVEVPPFASRRYAISAGSSGPSSGIKASVHSLENDQIAVGIDEKTGNITSLKRAGLENEFVDNDSTGGLNEYLFLLGTDLAGLQRSGAPQFTVKEQGPLLAEVRITSDAPGAAHYLREYRLVKGSDFVEIKDVLDKLPAELDPHPGDYPWANLHGKESLNFGFPFHVDQGQMRLDIPFGIMQPEKDQIPGSCKNWLEVGNWADVSNQKLGVTWVTLDAPLVEVGGITATMLGSQTNPKVWRKHIDSTQKLYSWALNNHWETNYRAYQDGIITFRYIVRPHGAFDPLSACQMAMDQSQPLIVAAASGPGIDKPRLQLSNQHVIALSLRPSLDGQAWMVTLYNPGDRDESTDLLWSGSVGAAHFSNTGESPLTVAAGQISVAGQGVVTIRVEKG
jgi:alpha-mannosidase